MFLKINALGIENSIRKQNDGVTYFGFQDDNSEVGLFYKKKCFNLNINKSIQYK